MNAVELSAIGPRQATERLFWVLGRYSANHGVPQFLNREYPLLLLLQALNFAFCFGPHIFFYLEHCLPQLCAQHTDLLLVLFILFDVLDELVSGVLISQSRLLQLPHQHHAVFADIRVLTVFKRHCSIWQAEEATCASLQVLGQIEDHP